MDNEFKLCARTLSPSSYFRHLQRISLQKTNTFTKFFSTLPPRSEGAYLKKYSSISLRQTHSLLLRVNKSQVLRLPRMWQNLLVLSQHRFRTIMMSLEFLYGGKFPFLWQVLCHCWGPGTTPSLTLIAASDSYFHAAAETFQRQKPRLQRCKMAPVWIVLI